MTTATFIVYACPVGELNQQIETYFLKSRMECGENAAHKYMPHCTLTGFFEDEISTINLYCQALKTAYKNCKMPLEIEIVAMLLKTKWQGLQLQGENLKTAIAHFAQIAQSPTQKEPIRLKDWLHLSLAYSYPAEHQEKLAQLATEIIDIQAPVEWELRFYQRHPDWTWTCHYRQLLKS